MIFIIIHQSKRKKITVLQFSAVQFLFYVICSLTCFLQNRLTINELVHTVITDRSRLDNARYDVDSNNTTASIITKAVPIDTPIDFDIIIARVSSQPETPPAFMINPPPIPTTSPASKLASIGRSVNGGISGSDCSIKP